MAVIVGALSGGMEGLPGVSVDTLRGVGVSETVSVGGGSGAAAVQADSRNTNISNAKHLFIFLPHRAGRVAETPVFLFQAFRRHDKSGPTIE
jgi:hypothetical protein